MTAENVRDEGQTEDAKPAGQRYPSGHAEIEPARGIAGRLKASLSGKLLVLTIIFVMIAEVLIFVPSVANYRNVWLLNKLDTAEVASIVFLDSSDPMLSETAQAQLLESTGALAVAVRAGPVSTMMATSNMPPEIDRHIDMTVMRPLESI